ncbi:hypothetical protein LEN26_016401 [Aphanomyces euteiches]|nr:hypothetical protein LEN26_016401 [Aphanomyces euteiches]KAH9111867.1 hypothetical protein AeMF1_013681 [Aphanomyces euteiches]KAH9188169.1 hypothetical protein AeNC1_009852 [Aphanomyces euteiches]
MPLGSRSMMPTRCFSSSPEEETPTTFQKAWSDRTRFNEWDMQGIFTPHMLGLKKMALFAMIHQAFPGKEAFDIPEFLEGAKHAFERVLRTVYSPAFLAAVVDPTIQNEEMAFLREAMTEECVNMLIQGFRIHHTNGCTQFDLTKLDIRGCYLDNIKLADDMSSMLVYVKFDTAEHVTVSGVKDGKEITESSVREAESNWIFESPIPDALQWTVIKM